MCIFCCFREALLRQVVAWAKRVVLGHTPYFGKFKTKKTEALATCGCNTRCLNRGYRTVGKGKGGVYTQHRRHHQKTIRMLQANCCPPFPDFCICPNNQSPQKLFLPAQAPGNETGPEHTAQGDNETMRLAYCQEAWGDPLLLVVPGGISRQLQHLSAQVLQHGGQVHGGPLAHPGSIPPRPDE